MRRRAEAAPIVVVLPELRQAGIRHGPTRVNVTVIEVVARVVGKDIRIEPEALALNRAQGSGRNQVGQRLVEDGIVDAGGEARVELVPEASLQAILLEVPSPGDVTRLDHPQVVGVEDVVGDVFDALGQAPRRSAAGFGRSWRHRAQRFQYFPHAGLVLVHHPAMVALLAPAIRQDDVQRPQGDADAVAADARGQQQGRQEKGQVFTIAAALRERFIGE